MDKEKLLDEYIREEFSDCEQITPKERKYIANTAGFACFCLHAAWEAFKENLTKTFPFSLFFEWEEK